MDALEQARAEIDTWMRSWLRCSSAGWLPFCRWPNISGRTACPSTMPPGSRRAGKGRSRIQQLALRPYYKDHVQHMMDLAKQYEAAVLGRNRAAYQGVEGAFAHIALKALFPTPRP